ncbi:MAG: glycoside hydrolase family 26 protein [Bacteriovorax sp.]
MGKKLILLVLVFFQSCAHEKSSLTLKGMHDTIGGIQSEGMLEVERISNSSVKVISSDFGFSTHPNDDYRKRNDLLKKFLNLSPKMKIITLSYHQCRPDIDGPCAFGGGVANHFFNESEWDELLTWNSPLNKKWQLQMRELGEFISTLKKNGIKIYLRPYHESNIPLFWWSDIRRPDRSIALWKMLHRFYSEDMKLDNIIWVWAASFHPKHIDDLQKFYPGDEWVDVLGVDIYPPAKTSEPLFSAAWKVLKKISPNKPLALSEVSRLPSEDELKDHNWLYVVPWGISMLKRDNTLEEIRNFYGKK